MSLPLCFRFAFFSFVVLSPVASLGADYDWVSTANTVTTRSAENVLIDGRTGQILGTLGTTQNPPSVRASISTFDKWGNKVSRITNLVPNVAKLKGFWGVASRLGGPIVTGLQIMQILNSLDVAVSEQTNPNTGLTTVTVTQGASLANCIFETTPYASNQSITRNVVQNLPCIRSTSSSSIAVWSQTRISNFEDQGVSANTYESYAGNPHTEILIYWYNVPVSNGAPAVDMEVARRTLTDAELKQLFIENPVLGQVEPGKWASVFDDVWIDGLPTMTEEEALEAGSGSGGDDGAPEQELEYPEEIVDVGSLPTEEHDIFTYYDWGSKWLPGSCPEPLYLSIQGSPFEIEFDIACDSLVTYVAPFMRIAGLLMFVGIIFRGVR